ncbi:MAG: cellulase family glycosylhydrolase [Planctomycetaceae bacterium]
MSGGSCATRAAAAVRTCRRLIRLLAVVCLVGRAAATEEPSTRLPTIRVAADGRTLETDTGRPFVPFGVTYYRPGTGWAPQVWRQFDAEATRRDFARLKALGGTCVRVFLTYGSFCGEQGRLTPEGAAAFDRLLAMAEESGLYVHPAGPDHWEGVPAWASGEDIVSEEQLAGLEVFWREFAARYRGRSAIFAYDLRNEPQVPWDGPVLRRRWNAWLARRYATAQHAAAAWNVDAATLAWGAVPPPDANSTAGRWLLDYQEFREEIADEWTLRQAAAIRAADPRALVTVGLIQWSVPALLANVRQYSGFRPARQARHLDFLEVHFYPFNDGFFTYANDEAEDRNLAYAESVVREVAAAGKPVVVAEFGWYGGGRLTIEQGRHPPATEAQQARWNRRLIETTAGVACGWLNWGFYDHPQAHDVSQLTGLLAVDGRTKAWGTEFQKLARRFQAAALPSPAPADRPALDWDRCLVSTGVGDEFRERYYQAFRAARAEAAEPAAAPAAIHAAPPAAPVENGAVFAAADSLAADGDDRADADRCLAGLCWPPKEFAVTIEAAANPAEGDCRVRFPSPVAAGPACNDTVWMEWYQARDATGAPGTGPACVVVHESGSGMTVGRLVARGLAARGVHAFMVQLPFYGARRPNEGRAAAALLVSAVRQAVADVRRARDAVACLPLVDAPRISLQGTSLGGFVAATAAGLDDGYDKVFIFLAGGDLSGVLEKGAKDARAIREKLAASGMTAAEISETLEAIEPTRLAHRYRPDRTWIYSGRYDDVVPLDHGRLLADAAGLADDHHVILEANHYTGIVYLPILLSRIAGEIAAPVRAAVPEGPVKAGAPW